MEEILTIIECAEYIEDNEAYVVRAKNDSPILIPPNNPIIFTGSLETVKPSICETKWVRNISSKAVYVIQEPIIAITGLVNVPYAVEHKNGIDRLLNNWQQEVICAQVFLRVLPNNIIEYLIPFNTEAALPTNPLISIDPDYKPFL